ncbi:MAG: hypothetical protein LUH16_04285 [Clostridiales bacterium]|nr:hypothetical protein [Clostridiales bacterium]
MTLFKNKSGGFYLTILAAILTIVALVAYSNVMYTYSTITVLLVIALALELLPLLWNNEVLTGAAPVLNAALLASAGMWSASVMVNQIAYVISGLDEISTIVSYIVYASVVIVGILLNIAAAFLKWEK